MAHCITKHWVKIKVMLVIVLLIYLAQFVSVHLSGNKKISRRSVYLANFITSRALSNVTSLRKSTSRKTFAHLSTYKERSVEYTYNATSNRTQVWKLKYNNFNLSAPLFCSENSSRLFFKNAENRAFIGAREMETLKGEVYLVRNGSYSLSGDCGYRSDPGHVLVKRGISKVTWYRKAAAFYSPEAWTFQHFMDGALPKIIQALDLLQDPNVTVLFRRAPRDKIITEILARLNITRNRIVVQPAIQFGADYFYFTCIAPPIHPVLWQTARRLIGVPEKLSIHVDRAFIVFVTRKGCRNCGRLIRNENDVVSMLNKRYGESRVRLFTGGLNLTGVIDLFGNARIIMGSHGGGMYNINFAPINTTVIEFMPTNTDGSMVAASKMIIWSQANLLGQIYWRMSIAPVPGTRGDMVVNLKELAGILNATDVS